LWTIGTRRKIWCRKHCSGCTDRFIALKTATARSLTSARSSSTSRATRIAAVAALTTLVVSVTDYREGALLMNWWILELITAGVLVAINIALGPFIKRFGRSYAAEVFRANPNTGKSFIVLMDFAYYLIFGAYVLLTLTFQPRTSWAPTVNAAQFGAETVKVACLFLIMGVHDR
jgi:hypothetical protein